MTVQAKDIGFVLTGVNGFANGAATAAGTGDAAYKAGAIQDMHDLNHPLSGKVLIPFTATLAEGKTASFKSKIEHGDESDLSDAATYSFGGAEVDHGVQATGDTGGSTEVGIITRDVDLSGIKRYFRISVYIDLNATGTDTAEFAACMAVGGESKCE